jgi:hypothetical protein
MDKKNLQLISTFISARLLKFMSSILLLVGIASGCNHIEPKEVKPPINKPVKYDTLAITFPIYNSINDEPLSESEGMVMRFSIRQLIQKRTLKIYELKNNHLYNDSLMKDISLTIQDIKQNQDRKKAILVKFNVDTPFYYFMKVCQTFSLSPPKTFAPFIDDGVYAWYP